MLDILRERELETREGGGEEEEKVREEEVQLFPAALS